MTCCRGISTTLYLFLVCSALGSPPAACAQNVEDAGLWFALFAQGDLDHKCCGCSRLKWWFDGHARFLDDADGFSQSIVSPGIGYSLTEAATLWAGYAWVRISPILTTDIDEHRPWQQLIWSQDIGPTNFALRSRLEQRFLSVGDETGWRFRQLFRVRHPLPNDPRFSLVAWDEILIHLNDTDWGARAGFNQNRFFAGIGWKRNQQGRWRTDVGYLYQEINIPGAGNNVSNHILSINFFRKPYRSVNRKSGRAR